MLPPTHSNSHAFGNWDHPSIRVFGHSHFFPFSPPAALRLQNMLIQVFGLRGGVAHVGQAAHR